MLSDRDCLFACALHVEGRLALALQRHHAFVESPCSQHGPKPVQQQFGVDVAGPRTDGLGVAIEDPDQRRCQILDVVRIRIDLGAAHGPGLRHLDPGEIRLSPWADGRFGHPERQWSIFGHRDLVCRLTIKAMMRL